MFYCPKQNKKGIFTAAALIVLSFVVASMSQVVAAASGIFNMAGIFILTAALFITVRFVISGYEYEITSDSFVITKITGQRRVTVAALALSEGVGVERRPSSKAEKELFAARFGKTDKRMNFCRNLFAKQYVFVTDFNGQRCEILIETDEDFARALSNAAESASLSGDDDNF